MQYITPRLTHQALVTVPKKVGFEKSDKLQ